MSVKPRSFVMTFLSQKINQEGRLPVVTGLWKDQHPGFGRFPESGALGYHSRMSDSKAQAGGWKADVLLIVSVMALILAGVGTLKAFTNTKDVDDLDAIVQNLTDSAVEGDEILGNLAERVDGIAKTLGMSGTAEAVDLAQEIQLLKRDVQEANKHAMRVQQDKEQLRAKLNELIPRLEAMELSVARLERAKAPVLTPVEDLVPVDIPKPDDPDKKDGR
jgi:predicted nuclease with TOPRIM domain